MTGGSSPGTTTYGYGTADPNVLTSVTPPSGPAVSYGVDSAGNTTARGSDSFSWNGESELVAGTIGGQSFAARYNGDGLRATRTLGSTTTSFVWGNGQVLDDGTQYVYGAGLVEHVTSGGTYYVLADGSGSTVALVDGSGTVQQQYAYDVYGNVTASSGSQPTEYTYDGQQTDGTGLQYLRARYYDPSSGRFLSRDPSPGCVFNPATHNPYTFAGNNPVTNGDPSGQDYTPQFGFFTLPSDTGSGIPPGAESDPTYNGLLEQYGQWVANAIFAILQNRSLDANQAVALIEQAKGETPTDTGGTSGRINSTINQIGNPPLRLAADPPCVPGQKLEATLFIPNETFGSVGGDYFTVEGDTYHEIQGSFTCNPEEVSGNPEVFALTYYPDRGGCELLATANAGGNPDIVPLALVSRSVGPEGELNPLSIDNVDVAAACTYLDFPIP